MTWRETTPDALPSELLNTGEPTATLNGGSAGTTPILAEKVQDVVTGLRSDIADLQAEIDTLKGRGWHDITAAGGQLIDSNTTINVPAENTYDIIKVYARGSLAGIGFLSMRINADNTTDLHRRQRTTFNPATEAIQAGTSDAGTVWLAFPWSATFNNTAEATIFATDASGGLSFHALVGRHDGASADRRMSISGGDLSFNRTMTSIQFVGTNTTINSVRIWIEGHRV